MIESSLTSEKDQMQLYNYNYQESKRCDLSCEGKTIRGNLNMEVIFFFFRIFTYFKKKNKNTFSLLE